MRETSSPNAPRTRQRPCEGRGMTGHNNQGTRKLATWESTPQLSFSFDGLSVWTTAVLPLGPSHCLVLLVIAHWTPGDGYATISVASARRTAAGDDRNEVATVGCTRAAHIVRSLRRCANQARCSCPAACAPSVGCAAMATRCPPPLGGSSGPFSSGCRRRARARCVWMSV